MSAGETGAPIRVIIADDSTTVCKFVERALKLTGRDFDISFAHDGQQAVQLLSKQVFDIAFLDINMPQLNGIEVMAAIHVMGAKTFAVSMSDRLSEASQEKLKTFGAYDYLNKPFNNGQVRQLIETFEAIRQSYKVLVVDDSATVRRIVMKVLQKSIFDLEIDEAVDGLDAIEAVKKNPYRLVFTDFNMPNMNGIELAEKLAAYTAGSDVVLMSTEMSDLHDKAAQRVGAKAFLRKPFFSADVDTILHHLFGLKHSAFSKQVRMFAMSA
ncbi:Response regulator receiver domain-containing protein [Roseibium suaedae]|uniref:Response regulator receiver domain-containing protein n=2 Tax=Roseibium suaedae TaxID=735517 RepID=A0A1M7MKP4_9HYPH|nr:Response regulator receiver domain-containing protein [Roseibium suaedae]